MSPDSPSSAAETRARITASAPSGEQLHSAIDEIKGQQQIMRLMAELDARIRANCGPYQEVINAGQILQVLKKELETAFPTAGGVDKKTWEQNQQIQALVLKSPSLWNGVIQLEQDLLAAEFRERHLSKLFELLPVIAELLITTLPDDEVGMGIRKQPYAGENWQASGPAERFLGAAVCMLAQHPREISHLKSNFGRLNAASVTSIFAKIAPNEFTPEKAATIARALKLASLAHLVAHTAPELLADSAAWQREDFRGGVGAAIPGKITREPHPPYGQTVTNLQAGRPAPGIPPAKLQIPWIDPDPSDSTTLLAMAENDYAERVMKGYFEQLIQGTDTALRDNKLQLAPIHLLLVELLRVPPPENLTEREKQITDILERIDCVQGPATYGQVADTLFFKNMGTINQDGIHVLAAAKLTATEAKRQELEKRCASEIIRNTLNLPLTVKGILQNNGLSNTAAHKLALYFAYSTAGNNIRPELAEPLIALLTGFLQNCTQQLNQYFAGLPTEQHPSRVILTAHQIGRDLQAVVYVDGQKLGGIARLSQRNYAELVPVPDVAGTANVTDLRRKRAVIGA